MSSLLVDSGAASPADRSAATDVREETLLVSVSGVRMDTLQRMDRGALCLAVGSRLSREHDDVCDLFTCTVYSE